MFVTVRSLQLFATDRNKTTRREFTKCRRVSLTLLDEQLDATESVIARRLRQHARSGETIELQIESSTHWIC